MVRRAANERTIAVAVYARHRVRNPASARVLANLGMKRAALLRQRGRKREPFEDVVLVALLSMMS